MRQVRPHLPQFHLLPHFDGGSDWFYAGWLSWETIWIDVDTRRVGWMRVAALYRIWKDSFVERIQAMWKLISILLLLFVCGCGATDPQELAERNESDLAKLLANAKKIKVSVEKTKRELTEQSAKCEEVLVKVNALLGHTPPAPQPVDPKPIVPKPVEPVVPKPVDPVVPPKPVDPEPADGRFAIAKSVYRIAMGVDSPDKVLECQALAANFEAVASQIQAGALNGSLIDPQWHKISSALTAGNKPVIAKHLSAWDGPAKQLGEAIGKKYSEGKLDKNQDWADLLNEIAIGLRAVR